MIPTPDSSIGFVTTSTSGRVGVEVQGGDGVCADGRGRSPLPLWTRTNPPANCFACVNNAALVQIAIILVGLPARGKTFISQKLARYLNWIGCNTRTFDVGHYRRHSIGAKQTHEFFDPGALFSHLVRSLNAG